MPTLADIYSAIDTLKRKGADFVQNPGTSLEQMLGNANDRARALNELTARAAQETQRTGKIYGNPAQEELTNSLADAYNPVGMTVWHGSPHVFERFDLKKMGTGEGGQAYGSGLYMAQAKQTGEEYSKMGYNPYRRPKDAAESLYLDRWNTVHELEKQKQQGKTRFGDDWNEIWDKRLNQALSEAEARGPRPENLYKVDLPDTHIRRMLDWDAPLKDQPYPVRNLAKNLGMDMKDLGGDLIGKIGKGEEGRKILQDAGIPGIKYFDRVSRDSQKGTRNFVVFDPNHLTILERNAKSIK